MGLFVARPGYSCLGHDPNNRDQFFFSSTWGRQIRIVGAGVAAIGANIMKPTGFGQVFMTYRLVTSTTELSETTGSVENLGNGDGLTYSVYYSRDYGTFWRVHHQTGGGGTVNYFILGG
jgi:hypothetical protein